MEPAAKKIKIENACKEMIEAYIATVKTSAKNLVPIINDDFDSPVPLTEIAIGVIKNKKDISNTIKVLNEKIPIKELQHLKRVVKNKVVICTVSELNGVNPAEYIERNAEELKEVLEDYAFIEVPSQAPKIKKQFDEANKTWSCNFHPNKYNEKLVSGNFFTEQELIVHRQYMEIVLEVVKYNIDSLNSDSDDINAAVVVDPQLNSIVAVSLDHRSTHPIQHAAMLAIDNVAKTQNGGAWVEDREKLNALDVTIRGIDEDLLQHLKKLYPDVKFGAKVYKSKRDYNEKESSENVEIGPYLCTGYYVYMFREPCLMCSMALVHARSKRVFFCVDNKQNGGLKSLAKLQTVSSLNHHFEVFTGFL